MGFSDTIEVIIYACAAIFYFVYRYGLYSLKTGEARSLKDIHSSSINLKSSTDSRNRPREAYTFDCPLAMNRFLNEAIGPVLILTIIWGCIVIYPLISIAKSGAKITYNDLVFLLFIGFVVLACSGLCLWWLYIVIKSHKLTSMKDSYSLKVSNDELEVGLALLAGSLTKELFNLNAPSIKIPIYCVQAVEEVEGGESGKFIKVKYGDPMGNGDKTFYIFSYYLGESREEIVRSIKRIMG